MDNLELKQTEQRTQAGIKTEENWTRELQNKLRLLKSRDYIEKLARTRLGLIKKGEKAYKVIGR